MENSKDISQQLIKVAESLDKIAQSLEEEQSKETENSKKDFGFGKVGSNTASKEDPLLNFIFS